MSERLKIVSTRANNFITEKFQSSDYVVQPVEGGYSLNRRAIIDTMGQSVFVKEVDTDILPEDGRKELDWLKKDYEVITELNRQGVSIVPDWAELHLDGHLLIIPSYKKEDGWHWSPPDDDLVRSQYIQAVVDATKDLESVVITGDLVEKLSLQPFFRDEIAHDTGIVKIHEDLELRNSLIERYGEIYDRGGHLAIMAEQMIETLKSDDKLRDIYKKTLDIAKLSEDCFNHCDVRSDNIAYNHNTNQIKLVDWNWASYAPAKFGATEFLLDMSRRGADVSPWYDDMSSELLAGTVGYYMIRCLRPALYEGSDLRDMQAEAAAVANYLYYQIN